MIGIALCTHSNFATGLKDACEMISGVQENFVALGYMGDETIEEYAERLGSATEGFTDGCIFVTDLANATPFNAALIVIAYTQNLVVSGASLPLVIDLLAQRRGFAGSCKELSEAVLEFSPYYISTKCSKDIFGS